MTAGHTLTITPSDVHVEVWVGGHKVAESDAPLVLEETGMPTRYYLPREHLDMDLFRATTFTSVCPLKGSASYWTLELDGDTHDGIVWSYEDPIEGAEQIKGLMAFYNDRVDLRVG